MTTGKGKISEMTWDTLKNCNLRTAHNVRLPGTRIATLREALLACKDRIVINVDQGYEYYDLVLAETESLGMTDQILIKGKMPRETVAADMAGSSMMYMPIIDCQKARGKELFGQYESYFSQTGESPLAYEVCFSTLDESKSTFVAIAANSDFISISRSFMRFSASLSLSSAALLDHCALFCCADKTVFTPFIQEHISFEEPFQQNNPQRYSFLPIREKENLWGLCYEMFSSRIRAFCKTPEKFIPRSTARSLSQSGMVSVFFTALPFGLSVASTNVGKQFSGTGMLIISDAAGRLPPRSRIEAQ
jgi:hypothetical protein